MKTARIVPPAAARSALVVAALLLALVPLRSATASTTVVAHVPVGMNPAAVAVDPVSHRVFVADYFGDSVHLIDGVTDSVVATVSMPTTGAAAAIPISVVADPLTGDAWVANWQSHWVTRVDGDTGGDLGSTRVSTLGSGNPRALALDPTSVPPKLYVANYHRNSVSVIDASTGALLHDIGVGASPRALALFVGGGLRRLFVADRYGAQVDVIDAATDSVLATAAVGEAPKAIAVDPGTGCAWVTSTASDTVSVLSADGSRLGDVAVGDNPIGAAVDPSGRRVFVANYYSASVSVIDADTRAVVATVPTGAQPYAVAFDQSQRVAYVTCYGSSAVTVIDSTLVPSQVAVGDRPYGAVVDEGASPHKAYVTEWGANAVSVLDPPGPTSGPVTVSVDAIAGDATTTAAPALTGSAVSARAPYGSAVVAVFWRLDGERQWRRAQITQGEGTPAVRWAAQAPSLPPGRHAVEVAAMDQALAVSSSSDQAAGGASAALGSPTSYAFDVLTHVEETDPRIVWEGSWTSYASPTRSGGSWRYCATPFEAADIAFSGTEVRLISSKAPSYACMRVSVDGGEPETVDLYSPQWQHRQEVFRRSGLSAGAHTVRIEHAWTRNEASTGMTIGLDAVEVVGDLTQAVSPLVRFEETDGRLQWEGAWTTYASPTRSGGSWRYTSSPLAAMNMAFSGTEVRLISSRSPSYGSFLVSVDGEQPARLSLSSPYWEHQRLVYFRRDLAPGPHVLRLWPESGSGTIGVDAVEVIGDLTQATSPLVRVEESDPRLVWEGRWISYASATRSGGSWRYTSSPGAAADVAFTGSEVRLVSSRSPGYGIAEVSVDGGAREAVDLYAPFWAHGQVVYRRDGLSPGPHTIRISYDGAKNLASYGTTIGVDAVEVVGTVTQAPAPSGPAPLSGSAQVLNGASNKKMPPVYLVTANVGRVPAAEVAALGGTTVEYELFESALPGADLAALPGSTLQALSASPSLTTPWRWVDGLFYQVRATVRRADGSVAARMRSELLGPSPAPEAQQTLPVPPAVLP